MDRRWINGWIDGWMDDLENEWMDPTDGLIDAQMDVSIDELQMN